MNNYEVINSIKHQHLLLASLRRERIASQKKVRMLKAYMGRHNYAFVEHKALRIVIAMITLRLSLSVKTAYFNREHIYRSLS